ncbi:MAG: MlaD family protein [Thermoanaerobaculia bacterium]
MAKMNEKGRLLKVGLLVSASLIVLMAFLFFIGSEQKLFSRKNEYRVRLESVSGLAEGNPVQIAGVTVGTVRDIRLPENPKARTVDIVIQVDRKYADRIRQDSRAKLRKLGLIASDSYIEITPGSPQFPVLEPGSIIPAQRQTNVEALISSGEDLVDNFVQISYSLKNILQRVDRGEGLLGELTTQPANKQRLTDTLMVTLNRMNKMLGRVEKGEGLVGKLMYDDEYANEVAESLRSSAHSMRVVMASLESGFSSDKGAVPALLTDPAQREKVVALIDNLSKASGNIVEFSQQLHDGQGLLPRLISDKEFADQSLQEFNALVKQLDTVAAKLNGGEGTAGRLINDPSVYESINDILIGINESKLLRWLIRNRQKKGIEQRYQVEQKNQTENGPPAPDGKSSTSSVPEPPPPASKLEPGEIPPPPPPPEPAPATETAPAEQTPAEPATTPQTDTQSPPAAGEPAAVPLATDTVQPESPPPGW